MLLFCPNNRQTGSQPTCEFQCRILLCSPCMEAGGDCIFLFLYLQKFLCLQVPFFLKSDLIGQWAAVRGSVLGRARRRGLFFFLKEHQCRQSQRAEDVIFSHKTVRLSSSLQDPTPTMCYCHQAIHSGGQNERAQKLPPFTSYVQHHDSGKNRHSIISTKPPT